MWSVTSTNAVLMLTVPGIFAVPQQIQGFSADAAFEAASQELAQTQMGVDGFMSYGYTPNPSELTITLQAGSPSWGFFNSWVAGTKAARECYPATGELQLPSQKKRYILTGGVLRNAMMMEPGRRVLQPTPYIIVWENIGVSPI